MAYANKYYDPVKAHEYYEKHKQLKGRKTSTKGMTSTQKEMAAYVKDKLNAEKKQKIQAVTSDSKSQKEKVTAQAQKQRAEFSEQCSEKIAALRKSLKNMSKSQKAIARKVIQKQIEKIKNVFAERKSGVTVDARAKKQDISSAAKVEKENIRNDYSNKYSEALLDIRNNVK